MLDQKVELSFSDKGSDAKIINLQFLWNKKILWTLTVVNIIYLSLLHYIFDESIVVWIKYVSIILILVILPIPW